MQASPVDRRATRGQRPRASTVFVAAFLAGAAAAVGLNRSLDVHLASCKPQVESEPIFVALRPLPQGAPVTVWDVALRDWPKAMLPTAAMRPHDSFEGMVLRQPIREGQPILTVQLAKAAPAVPEPQVAVVADVPAAAPTVVDAGVQSAAPVASQMVAVVPMDAGVRSAEPVVAAPVEPLAAPAATVPAAPTAVAETPAAELPQPQTVAQEPTLATPMAETAAPLVAEPILVSTPALTEIDSVITDAVMSADRDVAPPREPVMRYLVVPERIALEADRSFVPPPEPQPTAATTPGSDSQTAANPSPRPRTQQGRADGSERTSSSRDSHMQRPPRSASGQNPQAAKGESTWSLRSMLPSLSIGMGAREPATSGQRTPDASRPASRGFGLFR